ncbi:hypothetical protein ACFY93_21675 [Streptomyces sp. NPDC008313]|uniref:hypothetical protein n=1 Tax=Streptomyces sp. NPDC008313 TaxID=3364826 RepID=UPI0036E87E2D
MVRKVVAAVLALIGAAAAVWSPFRAWYDGRHGRFYRLGELFSGGGVTNARAELFASLFLPFLVAAALAVIGVLLRSRLLLVLGGLITLAFAVLWMIRVGQAEGGLTANVNGTGLGIGTAAALGGGALMLISAAMMGARGPGRGQRLEDREDYPQRQAEAQGVPGARGYEGEGGYEAGHTAPLPPTSSESPYGQPHPREQQGRGTEPEPGAEAWHRGRGREDEPSGQPRQDAWEPQGDWERNGYSGPPLDRPAQGGEQAGAQPGQTQPRGPRATSGRPPVPDRPGPEARRRPPAPPAREPGRRPSAQDEDASGPAWHREPQPTREAPPRDDQR